MTVVGEKMIEIYRPEQFAPDSSAKKNNREEKFFGRMKSNEISERFKVGSSNFERPTVGCSKLDSNFGTS